LSSIIIAFDIAASRQSYPFALSARGYARISECNKRVKKPQFVRKLTVCALYSFHRDKKQKIPAEYFQLRAGILKKLSLIMTSGTFNFF